MKTEKKKTAIAFAVTIAIGFLLTSAAIIMCSCNVTRQVTTSSEYYQRGDTSVMIMTKTIETYDASKK